MCGHIGIPCYFHASGEARAAKKVEEKKKKKKKKKKSSSSSTSSSSTSEVVAKRMRVCTQIDEWAHDNCKTTVRIVVMMMALVMLTPSVDFVFPQDPRSFCKYGSCWRHRWQVRPCASWLYIDDGLGVLVGHHQLCNADDDAGFDGDIIHWSCLLWVMEIRSIVLAVVIRWCSWWWFECRTACMKPPCMEAATSGGHRCARWWQQACWLPACNYDGKTMTLMLARPLLMMIAMMLMVADLMMLVLVEIWAGPWAKITAWF